MEYKHKFLKIVKVEVKGNVKERYGIVKADLKFTFDNGEKYRPYTVREVHIKHLQEDGDLESKITNYFIGSIVEAWYSDDGEKLGGVNKWKCQESLARLLEESKHLQCKCFDYPVFTLIKSLGKPVSNDGRIRFQIVTDPLSTNYVVNKYNVMINEDIENNYYLLTPDNVKDIYDTFYKGEHSKNPDKSSTYSIVRDKGIESTRIRYGKYDGSSRTFKNIELGFGEIIQNSRIVKHLISEGYSKGWRIEEQKLPFY